MNLSKTIVSKKVSFTKKDKRMKKAIVIQVLILVAAWYFMTPDQLVDNTWIFGLIGSVETVKGNADWILLGAAGLSVLNIWLWWPKTKKVKVTNTPETVKESEGAKSEAKAVDPIVPKMD